MIKQIKSIEHAHQNNSLESVIKQSYKKKSIIFNFRKTWAAYLVLILLIVAIFSIRDFIEKEVISDMKIEFDKSCTSVVHRIESQFDKVEQVITSTQGLYYENVQVVRDYFELYGIVPVKTYSFIMSLSYAPKVLYSDWNAFHYAALSEGYDRFDLHPSGARNFYYPAEHIVELKKNEHRLAYDYATDDIIKTAIDTSIVLNEVVSTEFYNLRPDTLSFALIAPIFKKNVDLKDSSIRLSNFVGSLVMELNSNDFFTTALSGEEKKSSFPTDTSLIFAFVDKNSKEKETNIYTSKNYSELSNNKFTPMISSEVPIKFKNRNITAVFYTSPNFANSMQTAMPMVALVISLIISIIAFVLLIMLLTQKARAEDVAERMTESQRRITNSSKDIIAAIGMDGKWLSMNPASIGLLGVTPANMIGTSITNYFYKSKDIDVWNEIINNKNSEDSHVDLQFKINIADINNNENYQDYKWIGWNFTVSKEENIIYAIGRDITSEKQAEQEANIRAKQLTLSEMYSKESISSKNLLMTQLNHKLRNELTASMGYLQLLSDKFYDTQEELDMYISSASQGFEKAFMVISDTFEATLGEESYFDKLFVHRIEDVLDLSAKKYYMATNKELDIKVLDNSKNAHIIADKTLISQAFENIFNVFEGKAEFQAVENFHEGITEIMIEADVNSEVSKFIEVFNKKSDSIFELLRHDYNDILFNIAKADSLIKTMLGNFKIDKIEANKGYVFITMPLVEKFKQELV